MKLACFGDTRVTKFLTNFLRKNSQESFSVSERGPPPARRLGPIAKPGRGLFWAACGGDRAVVRLNGGGSPPSRRRPPAPRAACVRCRSQRRGKLARRPRCFAAAAETPFQQPSWGAWKHARRNGQVQARRGARRKARRSWLGFLAMFDGADALNLIFIDGGCDEAMRERFRHGGDGNNRVIMHPLFKCLKTLTSVFRRRPDTGGLSARAQRRPARCRDQRRGSGVAHRA